MCPHMNLRVLDLESPLKFFEVNQSVGTLLSYLLPVVLLNLNPDANGKLYTILYVCIFLPQGHHVACVHRRSLCGGKGEGQSGAPGPEGDRVMDLSAAALTGACCRSAACGCGGAAPWAAACSDVCPSRLVPLQHCRLPAPPAAGAAGSRCLSAGPGLHSAGAQGTDGLRNTNITLQMG